MKTSTVIKEARKLIESSDNWDGSTFSLSDPMIGVKTYCIIGAIEHVVGTPWWLGLSNEDESTIDDFAAEMTFRSHKDALEIMDKLIKLAVDRGI